MTDIKIIKKVYILYLGGTNRFQADKNEISRYYASYQINDFEN